MSLGEATEDDVIMTRGTIARAAEEKYGASACSLRLLPSVDEAKQCRQLMLLLIGFS